MFCENCGKQNQDNATFCEGCGSALAGAPIENTTKTDDTVKKIAILAGGVAVIIILLAIFGAFTPGSLKALKKYNNGYLTANGKAVWAVEVSPFEGEFELDKEDKKEAIEEMEEEMREEREDRRDEGIKISFKNYKVSKKYKKKEVKKISEYLEDNMGYDMDEHKLQAVHVVKYTMVKKEDGDKETDTDKEVMMKIKGKWYLAPLSESMIKSALKADKD